MVGNELFKDYKIILASKSPRRHYLIKEMGIDFEIKTKEVDEVYPEELKAEEIALFLCKLKADAFTESEIDNKSIVITADTIVWFKDGILHKPNDFNDAINILQKLSGERHEVYTGVCMKSNKKTKSFYARSDVYFRKLSLDEIEWYIKNYKPFDKAGAYGAQEWLGYIGIEKIEGSYFNVMGLPTQKLYDELVKFVSVD
ncbi:MAG: Maf family nucleotide pyrophosphatase [Saprospiraceae bacterium]|nr:Maf family nucleotide pyrophosphatase [Saprospiraceae bacterium]